MKYTRNTRFQFKVNLKNAKGIDMIVRCKLHSEIKKYYLSLTRDQCDIYKKWYQDPLKLVKRNMQLWSVDSHKKKCTLLMSLIVCIKRNKLYKM